MQGELELKRKVDKLLLWIYSLNFWPVWGVRLGDPNQGRYAVGSCLLDVINTLREGDYMRLVWFAA